MLIVGMASLSAQPAIRAPRNAEEFDQLFQKVKNWGRWGEDDQLGSANLVTAAKRKQALALVKDGTTVSLAHNPMTDKAEDNSSPFELHRWRLQHGSLRGLVPRLRAQPHRRAVPHPLQGPTYNGYARAKVNTDKGCTSSASTT